MATDETKRRRTGSYYTPDWIARWMVANVLREYFPSPKSHTLRILDPACGDGAFVLPILDWLAEQSRISPNDSAGRLRIVRDHVCAVDSDPVAIKRLRMRVAEWIGVVGDSSHELTSALAESFPCGDALQGNDWSSDKAQEFLFSLENETSNADWPVIDWPGQFSIVAAAGGFDLVIGNPPYRRERDSKSDFERIAASAIGRRWREPRMDLWHYFLHRGLDLLKPGGRLAYIVNSYWMSATSARALRKRLADESTIEEVVMLGAAPLFRGVSGQHMIFQLRKGAEPQVACRVHDLSGSDQETIRMRFSQGLALSRVVPQTELWSSDPYHFQIELQSGSETSGPLLGDFYDVRQGIAENPPFVTKKAAVALGAPQLTGHGIFVLTADEVEELHLDAHEQSLLRPYYALSAINRFQIASTPTHQLLYLTRRTAPCLDDIPRIAQHLQRFRAVLQCRREAQTGQMAWWHLHWPREERLFLAPRILSLQMGSTPRFAFAEKPTYVGFSMHVITSKQQSIERAMPSLPALTAILNSNWAQHWFNARAKHRGAHLDISGAVLKRFPLPAAPDPRIDAELALLTGRLSQQQDAAAESRLNQLVNQSYRDAYACSHGCR